MCCMRLRFIHQYKYEQGVNVANLNIAAVQQVSAEQTSQDMQNCEISASVPSTTNRCNRLSIIGTITNAVAICTMYDPVSHISMPSATYLKSYFLHNA